MQYNTHMPLDEVRALVAREISRHSGTITTSSEGFTSATFPKKFSWLWFLLSFGVFYLIYWLLANRKHTLTVTHIEQHELVTGSIDTRGRAAKPAAMCIKIALPGTKRLFLG